MRKAQFTKTLTVAISPELYEEIKRVTGEKEISISEWFRDVTETALSNSIKKGDQNNE